MNFWAEDSWFGFDKLDHFVYAVAGVAIFQALVGATAAVLVIVAGSIGLEVLQRARYQAWTEKGRPQPRPVQCDLPSFRDLAWDALGIIVGLLVTAV